MTFLEFYSAMTIIACTATAPSTDPFPNQEPEYVMECIVQQCGYEDELTYLKWEVLPFDSHGDDQVFVRYQNVRCHDA